MTSGSRVVLWVSGVESPGVPDVDVPRPTRPTVPLVRRVERDHRPQDCPSGPRWLRRSKDPRRSWRVGHRSRVVLVSLPNSQTLHVPFVSLVL